VHTENGVWSASVTSFSAIDVMELIHLNAGDKVRVQARQNNEGSAAVNISGRGLPVV
jgi:hypothetical protein